MNWPVRLLCLLSCLGMAGSVAAAPQTGKCYDLKVEAKPIEQVPSEIPSCDDCIVMRWPWFVDLAVKRVEEGNWRGRTVSVLTLQHTYRVSRYSTWLLRRNDAGGYNVVHPEDDERLARCAPEIAPARAVLRPGPGQSLESLRADAERRYGRHSD